MKIPMKIKTYIASSAMAAMALSGATAASAGTKVFTQLEDGTLAPAETYLGSIAYHGGLMERGTLNLTTPLSVNYLRFEIPASCNGTIFEAGTITEGVADVAKVLGHNRFAVNEGRGMRTRSIFASVNGTASAGCAILVFQTDDTTTPPPSPPSNYAYTCLSNATPYRVMASVLSQNWNVPFTTETNETVLLRSNLLYGGRAPFVTIAFDGDAGLGNHAVNVAVESGVTNAPQCDLLPFYNFTISDDGRRLELLRNH